MPQGDACAEPYVVAIDFQRVQTFLFSVPELKSIIGANVLLGEVLRGKLCDQGGSRQFVKDRQTLPGLALEHGACLPLDQQQLRAVEEYLPSNGEPVGSSGQDWDDPRTAYRQGILARDGGHFRAVFPSRENALAFAEDAWRLITEKLPGLQIGMSLFRWEEFCKAQEQAGSEAKHQTTRETIAPPAEEAAWGLPLWQPCEVSLTDWAYTEKEELGRLQRISPAVEQRRQAADRFNNGRSFDLIGLLRDSLLPQQGKGDWPTEFHEVARVSSYLAVAVADGNGLGQRGTQLRNQAKQQALKSDAANLRNIAGLIAEAAGERFYFECRTATRRALQQAIKDTFHAFLEQNQGAPPFRLLMLGGDDFVMVCDAAFALPFATAYARAIESGGVQPTTNTERSTAESTEQSSDASSRLTVGIGVAIVKPSFPFYRAHDLAEELASSAKKLHRSLCDRGEGEFSTIDWLVTSEAWYEDVDQVRRQDYSRRYRVSGNSIETILLTSKPYRVLKTESGNGPLSLEKLLQMAERWAGRVPRSKLHVLAEYARRGRNQGRLAAMLWADEQVKSDLARLHDQGQLLWTASGQANTWSTCLLDLMELYELRRLQGLQSQSVPSQLQPVPSTP